MPTVLCALLTESFPPAQPHNKRKQKKDCLPGSPFLFAPKNGLTPNNIRNKAVRSVFFCI
jgi:hypothetical protein